MLYWASPVVIIFTMKEEDLTDPAPMSLAWWLRHHCMLGPAVESQTTLDVKRTSNVLNLPLEHMVDQANALAQTSGRLDLSPSEKAAGYLYVKERFGLAQLTPITSDTVEPPHIMVYPVQMEAELVFLNEVYRDEGNDGIVPRARSLRSCVYFYMRNRASCRQANQKSSIRTDGGP